MKVRNLPLVRFKTLTQLEVAQWLEHLIENQKVIGSNPILEKLTDCVSPIGVNQEIPGYAGFLNGFFSVAS